MYSAQSVQTSRNQPHKITYQLISGCLHETNKKAREELKNEYRQQERWLEKFRCFLFLYPLFISFSPAIIFLFTLPFLLFIRSAFKEQEQIRLLSVLFCILLYLIIPLILTRITPKLDMGLHERWSEVINCCQTKDKWMNNLKQVKRDVNKAILSYRWDGKPWSFIVNLLWAGIFIGCLPDPNFQEALITMSFVEIFKANQFGALCLLFLPFIYICYFEKFEKPIVQMEIVITLIEFEDIDVG